jgi:ABC-type transport system involved in multi-copper enzyme maturation permease subunit
MYLAMSASLAAAALLLRNDIAFIQESGLGLMANPLMVPFFVAVLVASVFLAISSMTTIARERDQGTLETLFYGPVDEIAYILGKYLAQMGVFLVMMGGVLVIILAWAWAANLHVSGIMVWAILLASTCAGAIVGGGIMISVMATNVRNAIVIFVGIAGLFTVVQIGYNIVADVPVTTYAPLLVVREVLGMVNRLFTVLSPFAYLDAGLDALVHRNDLEYALWLAMSASFALTTLFLAVIALKRRGVRR